MSNVERELKLVPEDPALLDRLAAETHFGDLAVVGRRRQVQHNSFFDTASRSLSAGRIGFRRRTIEGQPMATWSLKADATVLSGIATRTEIELQLDADLAPVLALGALRQAARQRGATPLAEQVAEALSTDRMPVRTPFLELHTERTILDLVAAPPGWAVELALDRVQLVGHNYAELEIEAELKHGDEAALNVARQAIEALGAVHESDGSKLSRAMAHVAACDCATN
jgi:inorganic triphosphatase YgiF